MAGRQRHSLKGRGLRAAGVVAAVLVLHLAGLEWFARHHGQPPSALQALADPLFTRILVPAAPPPPGPSVAPAPAAKPPVERPTITALDDAKAKQEPPPEKVPEPAVEPAVEPAPEATSDTTKQASPDTAATPAVPLAEAEAIDRWPRDSRLGYALTGEYRGGALYGSAQVQWQRQGPLYQVRVLLDISLAGSRVMTSQGVVTPEGLVPHVYEETRGDKRRSVRMEDGLLRFENGSTQPLPPGVQDSASQFVELGHRFATGRANLKLGDQIQFWLARPNAANLWTYDVIEVELLKTLHHGEVEAFRLKPRPLDKTQGNISAEIWIAPSLQYLPVRIRVRMGDEAFVDLMVETIEQR